MKIIISDILNLPENIKPEKEIFVKEFWWTFPERYTYWKGKKEYSFLPGSQEYTDHINTHFELTKKLYKDVYLKENKMHYSVEYELFFIDANIEDVYEIVKLNEGKVLIDVTFDKYLELSYDFGD